MDKEELRRWHETIKIMVIDSYLSKTVTDDNCSGQGNGNGKEKSHA